MLNVVLTDVSTTDADADNHDEENGNDNRGEWNPVRQRVRELDRFMLAV